MIPVLFHIGPFPINSFGLMMVCTFLGGWRLLFLHLQAAGENPELAERMILHGAVGGIVGARLNYLLSFPQEFLDHPVQALFSGAGFIFYGGFLGGALAVCWLLHREKKPLLHFADLVCPTLALGYAIGRIGCHLSGDGDYGIASDLPWAVSYALGVVPTDPGVRVHPTPVYETIAAFAITWLLSSLLRRKSLPKPGQLFGLYFLLSATSRFLVEIIRIEPVVYAGLTQAQLMSIVMFAAGVLMILAAPRRALN